MPVSGAARHTEHEVAVTGYDTVDDLVLEVDLAYTDTTGAIGTIPAGSVITERVVIRTTPWDALTLFAVGKAGDTDWLVANHEHGLTKAGAGAELIGGGAEYVATDTPIIATWNQGAASQGEGKLQIRYRTLGS
jgi:hypothetical protein